MIGFTAMRSRILASCLVAGCAAAFAQHGTAPAGYYPASYSGDTFTGKVVGAEERKITLEYTNKSKTEQFVGVTAEPCMAPVKANVRTVKELHLTAIPLGSVITVLYTTKKLKNADGQKEEVHFVIGLSFVEVNGESLHNAPIIPCFTGATSFTYYGPNGAGGRVP